MLTIKRLGELGLVIWNKFHKIMDSVRTLTCAWDWFQKIMKIQHYFSIGRNLEYRLSCSWNEESLLGMHTQ